MMFSSLFFTQSQKSVKTLCLSSTSMVSLNRTNARSRTTSPNIFLQWLTILVIFAYWECPRVYCTITRSVHTITQSCSRRPSDDTSQFTFHMLEPKEIEAAFSNLDSNKSTGHDLIPPKILKSASRELSHPLADLYNRCIESCDWPLHWKKGDWVPVFKKDNKHDIKNYRPVTVLTVIGKVFEQLLDKQLTSFIDPKLSHNLTAYRKGQSRETSLIELVERWKRAFDNRNIVGVLSTDMSKAFDSLYPPLLINKLKAYGFSNNSLALMRSYFTNRKNRVRINQETTSDWHATTRGYTQGSAFRPLLCNVFQNIVFSCEV